MKCNESEISNQLPLVGFFAIVLFAVIVILAIAVGVKTLIDEKTYFDDLEWEYASSPMDCRRISDNLAQGESDSPLWRGVYRSTDSQLEVYFDSNDGAGIVRLTHEVLFVKETYVAPISLYRDFILDRKMGFQPGKKICARIIRYTLLDNGFNVIKDGNLITLNKVTM